jgi:CubicO group peptidase (beta-lactamase class C family)
LLRRHAQNVQPTPQEGLKGSLWALGIYGQVIMVNRAEHLVIVQWSTAIDTFRMRG